MLMALNEQNSVSADQAHQDESGHWHDADLHTMSLGCAACRLREICGGLNLAKPVFDCLDYCCGTPDNCDSVCVEKTRDYVQRLREVGGFDLDNVPRARPVASPSLPAVVPLLYNGSTRRGRFSPEAVSLPLYRVVGRKEPFPDAEALAHDYGFAPGTPVILSGTADDRHLERWWSRGADRLAAIRRLRSLNVDLVTTPNFSLFSDEPRPDDLHSMKRIAITHEEFLREGVPAALHVNARTDRDWERWASYIDQRREVTHIAYEFATGAGRNGRIGWHVDKLVRLSEVVGRPLHLVIRGGGDDALGQLIAAFDGVTVLDTTVFMKTVKRRRASRTMSGSVRWEKFPTDENAPLDELLEHNWWVVRDSYMDVSFKCDGAEAVE